MATFRAGGAFPIRMDHFDTNELWHGTAVVRSSNLLQVEVYKDDYVYFDGHDLTYHSSGAVTGGTVTALSEVFQGISMFRVTGLSVKAASLYGRVFSGDDEGFLELLLAKGDKITGSGSKDYLVGMGGKDTIKAGAGNDTLAGGDGSDTLYGGKGKDAFVFAINDKGNDIVKDFSVREDKIYIDRPGGKDKIYAEEFTYGTQAQDGDQRVIYDESTGRIFYDPDGTGYKPQVLLAKVSPGLHLTADHFWFI